jgi:hypothetical protein
MASSSGNAHSAVSRNEEEAVKAVIAATTDAFNKHDAKAWTRF